MGHNKRLCVILHIYNLKKQKNMINAEILADYLSPSGDRLATMKVTFPRIVLAKFNTHRMFSRNSASNRAIPFKQIVETVEENPFVPLAWTKYYKGIQGTEYVTDLLEIGDKRLLWKDAAQEAVNFSKALNKSGVTEQLCDRLLEPFMWHTVIVTATDWENFFKLRCPRYKYTKGVYFYSRKEYNEWALDQNEYYSDDKTLVEWLEINEWQEEIHMSLLAEAMYDALNESTPKKLKAGE